MKRWKIILILTLLALLLTGCEERTGLETILTASDCEPPCWMGIVPGETTQDEAQEQLRHLPELVDPESIFTASQVSGEYVGWTFVNSEQEGYIPLQSDTVFFISISDRIPYRDRYGIRLDRVIELYGTPTDIYYTQGGGDLVVLDVLVVNRETGIGYFYTQSTMDKLIVSPEQMVRLVLFFDPADYRSVVNNNIGSINLEGQHFEWEGFTEIPLSSQE